MVLILRASPSSRRVWSCARDARPAIRDCRPGRVPRHAGSTLHIDLLAYHRVGIVHRPRVETALHTGEPFGDMLSGAAGSTSRGGSRRLTLPSDQYRDTLREKKKASHACIILPPETCLNKTLVRLNFSTAAQAHLTCLLGRPSMTPSAPTRDRMLARLCLPFDRWGDETRRPMPNKPTGCVSVPEAEDRRPGQGAWEKLTHKLPRRQRGHYVLDCFKHSLVAWKFARVTC